MFTRQHYKAIAEIINTRIGDGFTRTDYDEGWNDAIRGIAPVLADYFEQDNMSVRLSRPNFDRQKFIDACGVE